MLLLSRSRYLLAFDVLLAAVVLVVVGYATVDAHTPASVDEPLWVSFAVALLIAVPVAVRRPAPVPAFAVCLAAALAAMVTGVIPVVAMGAPVTAVALTLYLVAVRGPRRVSVAALVAALGGETLVMLVERWVHRPAEPWSDSLFGLSFGWSVVVIAWTLGFAARERRRHDEAEAARRTEQAVAQERLRIARELHDIVAHSMSLIAVKAGIGNHVAEERPAEAREALRVIEATSRGSLSEMRHLLGVLRSGVDSAVLAPAPGPAGIPALLDRARMAGVEVTPSLADMSDLPEGIGLSVYRIVQEALTNVVRHAAPARCAVEVAVTEDAVTVEVTDDGPRGEAGPWGHGLIGMRERVAVYGGEFTAGPREQGGWRLSAVLPR